MKKAGQVVVFHFPQTDLETSGRVCILGQETQDERDPGRAEGDPGRAGRVDDLAKLQSAWKIG